MKRALVLLLLAVPAFAQTLDQRVKTALPSLLETYRTLHANPELSQQEAKSSALLADRLRALGYEVTYPFGRYKEPNTTCYGVVAVMKNGAGPTVLLRSDMDGLPIAEQTGLPYTSQNAGVMHACGHDVHVTCLVGVARAMSQLKDRWKGTLVLVGQPAEEVVHGARDLRDLF